MGCGVINDADDVDVVVSWIDVFVLPVPLLLVLLRGIAAASQCVTCVFFF
jgi:hypothetical protein